MRSLTFFTFVLFLAVVNWACQSDEIPQEVAVAMEEAPEIIDYNQHVKPILSDRCFKCHGPDKNKIEGGLQLATYEGATQENKEGRQAIVPGKITRSELARRILSHDPDEMMPTPQSNLTLTLEEKALLIKWIKQGAEYKEHWSLTKIKEPSVPRVGQSVWTQWGFASDWETDWVRNDIDRFTLAKMKDGPAVRLGLKPKPEADRATLLRRVSMDLTGLPPTPAEVAAFLADKSPGAYEKAVDRLLASPHYGEQQAVSWLDLARYADSNGYQDDALRTIYPYRDWVIRSFNQNLPLDQFVQYQIAGDLIKNTDGGSPTKDMLLATAFNRNHAQSEEDGIVPEEYQVEYVADRTNTFGKAFLGLTMECARCHDHKYDPISQKDYYSLFAFFNNINEHGQVPHKSTAAPMITLPKREVEAQLNFIRATLKKAEANGEDEGLRDRFGKWLAKGAKAPLIAQTREMLVDVPFDARTIQRDGKRLIFTNRVNDTLPLEVQGDLDFQPKLMKSPRGLGVRLIGESYLRIHETPNWWTNPNFNHRAIGNFERNEPFTVSLWVAIVDPKFEGRIFNRHSGALSAFRGYECVRLETGKLAFRINNVWPADAIDFETDFVLTPNRWTHLTMTYDGTSKANGLKVYINGQPASGKVITDHLTGSIFWEKNREIQKSYAASTNFSIGRMHTTSSRGYAVDELKIFGRVLTPLEVQSQWTGQDVVRKALQTSPGYRTDAQTDALFAYYATHIDPVATKRMAQVRQLIGKEVELLNKEIDVMVMGERSVPRKTFILNRGVYDAPGEEVQPETPLKIGALPGQYPRNRLGLAQWLLDEDNPLFARVMVNRLWQQYFGNGLVKTQEDFGNQGELPSHPELLDWLAVQYRKSGWNTKAFIRQMVLSATYRQSSVATKEEIERDPDNKWLARGSSYRFSAEQVRDNALAASGLLVRKIGGPSVFPYQPAGLWEALATRNVVSYRQQHGDSLYRRSMYTIWKRTSPPPMMLNFDSPDRSLCTVRRQKTATPLQALVTLNDPQFVEAARVLAEQVLKTKPTPDERIRSLFLSVVSRQPRPRELALMKQLYQTEYDGFVKSPARAQRLASAGEYPRTAELDAKQVAAYTVVANAILNYDEALVKR